jgi:predicted dehydrogenase
MKTTISKTTASPQHSSAPLSRRRFLGQAAAAWATISIVPARVLGAGGQTPPSEQITIGAIGLGIRGGHNDVAGLLTGYVRNNKCRILAVCDINRKNVEDCKPFVDQRYGNQDCKGYRDFRDILVRDDIDAVYVATPEHWHGPMTVLACEHGKDVYCEKPLAFSVRQGRAMVEAARRYNRVVTTGSHARSSNKMQSITQIIQEGKIGKLQYVMVICNGPTSKISRAPAEPIPDFVDWDLFVGPAEWRPYNSSLCLKHAWNGCISFGGGQITDWGAHFYDVAQWGLGMSLSGPVEIHPADGQQYKLPTLKYANGMEVRRTPTSSGGQGTDFIGTEGKISTMAWGDYAVFDPPSLAKRYQLEASLSKDQSLTACAAHIDNFLDCVRSRRKPNADVEIGHRSVTLAHISTIAERLNRSLRWDPVKEQFENDDEANRCLGWALREPWHV